MSKWLRLTLAIILYVSLLPVGSLADQSTSIPDCAPFPVDPANPLTSEIYLICRATTGNGDLVVYAHGYVAPNEALTKFLDQLALPDGATVPGLITGLGFDLAATSYSKNGLAVKEGVADVARLVAFYSANFGAPRHVYLIGASEGGLVTALAVEQHPELYLGGLAICGPIGDFGQQINYWGDFRALYDYFFPASQFPLAQIPDNPVDINDTRVWANWPLTTLAIAQAVLANPATDQLVRTSHAPIDPADSLSVITTTAGLLAYNAFATNDGKYELGGQPFDNWQTRYVGSTDDTALNAGVGRFRADRAATAEITRAYQTSGKLTSPLVTLHTTGDPFVPYWHEILYAAKTAMNGSRLKHVNIPIVRYGHCNFKASETVAALAILVLRASGQRLETVGNVLPDPAARAEYDQLLNQYLDDQTAP